MILHVLFQCLFWRLIQAYLKLPILRPSPVSSSCLKPSFRGKSRVCMSSMRCSNFFKWDRTACYSERTTAMCGLDRRAEVCWKGHVLSLWVEPGTRRNTRGASGKILLEHLSMTWLANSKASAGRLHGSICHFLRLSLARWSRLNLDRLSRLRLKRYERVSLAKVDSAGSAGLSGLFFRLVKPPTASPKTPTHRAKALSLKDALHANIHGDLRSCPSSHRPCVWWFWSRGNCMQLASVTFFPGKPASIQTQTKSFGTSHCSERSVRVREPAKTAVTIKSAMFGHAACSKIIPYS